MEIESVNLFAYLVAFAAGVISFLSPCVLPIVPGYLSIITGLDLDQLQEGNRRNSWNVVRDTSLFIAGFSSVFILLGLSATTVGQVVFENQLLLTRVSGAIVLAMALFLLGSILAIAATSGRATTGGTLLAVYSVGLGVPFLVMGLAFSRLARTMVWVKRRFTPIVVISAMSLAFFGVLLILNRLIWVTTELQGLLRSVGLDWVVELGSSNPKEARPWQVRSPPRSVRPSRPADGVRRAEPGSPRPRAGFSLAPA